VIAEQATPPEEPRTGMFFTARYTPGSQQTECAGAVIHQKWHAAVHTHPGDNMYVATAIPALWKRLTQPAGYSFRHPGISA
ncbi:hypothetical protein, partial [Escherichia coli]|uniref:hypothetical protein n=2 Tax=Escherichia coli TaxID=562 RepID=UPI001FCF1C41